MKHRLFIAVCLLTMVAGEAFAQATTEGKRFWVAIPFANGPDGAVANFEPFIAISAKQACSIKLSQPAGTWGNDGSQTFDVEADSWTIVSNGTSFDTPLTLPDDVWYNKSWTFTSASEPSTPFKYGILVEATEDVSVYAAMRGDYSYDASNILPEPTLQSEYLLQDYPGYDSDGKTGHSVFIILATEDNTEVEIKYSEATIGNASAAGTTKTITLNKGQTYQVLSAQEKTFSGTIIKAKNDKRIAVFSGADFTQIPGGKSARDCLYEQAMPVDYWGKEFIVTRSMDKDANRIRITALNDGTNVQIDGEDITVLNSGETYELELSENLASGDMKSAIEKIGRTVPELILTGDAHYIQTSCPCAVFNYDVSSQYNYKDSPNSKHGDPSMVWMSPVEQRINKITFGACGTTGNGYTNEHYVNVICLTNDVSSFSLISDQGKKYTVDFTPVEGNTAYSYARVYLANTDYDADKVFTMSNNSGFIAHVYGSGYNESYAYSVGSATAKQGIFGEQEGGATIRLEDGVTSTNSFCVGDVITFNAQYSSAYQASSVDWNFGDGVTILNGGVKQEHTYDSPGWYNLIAQVRTQKDDCSGNEYPPFEVNVTFRVNIPDTIREEYFGCEGDVITARGNTYSQSLEKPDTTYIDCDSVVIFNVTFGKTTYFEFDSLAYDSCFWHNKWYYESQDIEWKGKNAAHCDSIVTMHLSIMTCLQMEVSNPADKVCGDDDVFQLPYTLTKGVKEQISDIDLAIGSRVLPVSVYSDYLEVELSGLKPGNYNGTLTLTDNYCEREMQFPVEFSVLYPTSVFKQKWDNVLAVMNKDYNGGYEFTAFQWLKNGEPIEGATGSWYHADGTLEAGAEYSVLLTDKQGNQLASCPITIEGEAATEEAPKRITAHPTIANSGESILLTADGKAEVTIYNTLGQKEASLHFTDIGELQAPLKTGIYVMQAVFEDGSRDAVQLIIK